LRDDAQTARATAVSDRRSARLADRYNTVWHPELDVVADAGRQQSRVTLTRGIRANAIRHA
jgi:hypothetical protein